jgi:outer membrane protein assembly factor BamD
VCSSDLVASINRAQACIRTYPDTPANEGALAVMVAAYDKLGMNDLRDDTTRILKKNFPGSTYLAEGYTSSSRPWWKLW